MHFKLSWASWLAFGLIALVSAPARAGCEGDANGDVTVDPLDAGFVLARLGCAVGAGDPECDAADQNGDFEVDPLDVGFVLARFGDCPAEEEIVLRDSIGPDNTWTDGNFSWSSAKTTSGNPTLVPIKIVASENLTLKSIRMIVSQSGNQSELNWGEVDHKINLWSNWDAILANHYTGDVFSTTVDVPTIGPTIWGVSAFWTSWQTSYFTFIVEYDLTPYNLTMAAGAELWLGITFSVVSIGAGIVESTELGESDRILWGGVGVPSWIYIADDLEFQPISFHDGRVAVEIRGVALKGAD